MKTVFKSDQIPHLWARQRVPAGRCSSALMFSGTRIFSYSTWIGEILPNGVFVLNDTTYSNTMAKHQSRVRQAIPFGSVVFRVESVPQGSNSFSVGRETDKESGKRLLQGYLSKAAKLEAVALVSRKVKKDQLLAESGRFLMEAQRASDVFKLGKRISPVSIAKLAKVMAREEKVRSAQRLADADGIPA